MSVFISQLNLCEPAPALPPDIRRWALVEHELRKLFGQWSGQKMTEWVMRSWLSEANATLRWCSRVDGDFAEGWELRYFTTRTDDAGRLMDPYEAATSFRPWSTRDQRGRLTIIAVDPGGVGHDITALAIPDRT